MTEFEKWLESGEYKRDTKNHKIGVSVEQSDGLYKFELKNILDFAEVCFNKGLDIGFNKSKNPHYSLVNCMSNNIKHVQLKYGNREDINHFLSTIPSENFISLTKEKNRYLLIYIEDEK